MKYLQAEQSNLEARLAALEAKFAGGGNPSNPGQPLPNAFSISLAAVATASGAQCQVATAVGSTITAVDWDWGDGQTETGTNLSQQHHYTNPGNYTIKVTAHSSQGETASASQQITIAANTTGNSPVDVDFTYKVFPPGYADEKGVKVQFNAVVKNVSADHPIVSYDWNFRDGNVDKAPNSANAIRYFNQQGVYSVTLTVTDSSGATKAITKDVACKSGANPHPDTPLVVKLSAAPSGTPKVVSTKVTVTPSQGATGASHQAGIG